MGEAYSNLLTMTTLKPNWYWISWFFCLLQRTYLLHLLVRLFCLLVNREQWKNSQIPSMYTYLATKIRFSWTSQRAEYGTTTQLCWEERERVKTLNFTIPTLFVPFILWHLWVSSSYNTPKALVHTRNHRKKRCFTSIPYGSWAISQKNTVVTTDFL